MARYLFTQTGRTVVNDIQARFVIRDGLICQHDDSFDLWRWSRQALGLPGLLLGWSPLLQNKVRQQAFKGCGHTSKARYSHGLFIFVLGVVGLWVSN